MSQFAFIAGCFDGSPTEVLHAGHLHILREAAKLGSLIVGINHDDYIRRQKGREPLHSAAARQHALYASGFAQQAHVFYTTPIDLIMWFKPRFIVVGDDYTVGGVVGAKECHEWGGEVVIIPRLPGISTSEAIASANPKGEP